MNQILRKTELKTVVKKNRDDELFSKFSCQEQSHLLGRFRRRCFKMMPGARTLRVTSDSVRRSCLRAPRSRPAACTRPRTRPRSPAWQRPCTRRGRAGSRSPRRAPRRASPRPPSRACGCLAEVAEPRAISAAKAPRTRRRGRALTRKTSGRGLEIKYSVRWGQRVDVERSEVRPPKEWRPLRILFVSLRRSDDRFEFSLTTSDDRFRCLARTRSSTKPQPESYGKGPKS